ncbi:diguanylate cyclase (GGDEF)-like protein [Silvimonas terrae]|uniref:Diguanylate cyclase (GGDEF)-like protein n=1 Tax=Silvimonas terrae TaxID=300266 RepID=A0A840RM15_9NEIS|nr:EAL domain-containing protein [Silvimonas terrae]MBB5193316.1 diguanylate cyclase (GGDEF)-like protein [Silvimonas terrae]
MSLLMVNPERPEPVLDAALRGDAALQQAYFDALEHVLPQWLAQHDQDGLTAALATVGKTARARLASLYLNPHGEHDHARLVAVWRDDECRISAVTPDYLRVIEYPAFAFLTNTLNAGKLLNTALPELPLAEQMWLAQLGARRLLALPLLDRGVLFGFVCLLDEEETPHRGTTELRLLGLLAAQIAETLVRRKLEEHLATTQTRLQSLVGATGDMVFEVGANGVIGEAWSGHPALADARVITGRALADGLPASLAAQIGKALPVANVMRRGQSFNWSTRHNGVQVWFRVRVQPVAGGVGDAVVQIHDMTAHMQDHARRQTLLDTFKLLEEAVLDLSPAHELIESSEAWASLRGLEQRDAQRDLGKSLLTWIFPDDVPQVTQVLAQLENCHGETPQVRFRLMQQGGEFLWVEARLLPRFDEECHLAGIRAVVRDVTVAHVSEQHITQLALYDGLTKLPNRLMLDDQLATAIERARRNNTKVALGFLDLDQFKQINDAFGHRTGDQLLVGLAQQLKSVLGEHDILARWGGDEFVVLMPDVTDTNALKERAERLRSITRQGLALDGLDARPTVSAGFAVFPDNASCGEDLLSAADHTMHHAKHVGRNTVCFYGDLLHMKSLGREHVAIQARLADAIRQNRLQVFYQPIVRSRDGEVFAVEALARWQDEKNGWISPELFIPMAEKVGLIQELSDVVARQAFAKLREWRDAGLTQRLMLNISRSQLFAPEFVSGMLDLLLQFRLRPQDVILEITESVALTDYSRQLKHLRQLAAAGFQLAIDDFGTGYSSLSQLHEMPAALIKVDVSFAQRLHTEEGRRVMQAIVQLAQGLQLQTIIEGVESVETARFLQGMGVDYLQGFHFSEPVPSGVAELWMRLGLANKA